MHLIIEVVLGHVKLLWRSKVVRTGDLEVRSRGQEMLACLSCLAVCRPSYSDFPVLPVLYPLYLLLYPLPAAGSFGNHSAPCDFLSLLVSAA